MFTTRINFKCIMPGCDNRKDWYISPLEEKKGSSFVHSLTKYKIICKKSGKTYLLKFKIEAI